MPFLKSLYLTDRVFYALGVCITLFLVAFLFNPVFYVAVGALGCLVLLVLTDISLLYSRRAITAERTVAQIFSLHDPNTVTIKIANETDLDLRLKIIDEIPYQFNERDFSIKAKIKKGDSTSIRYTVTPTLRGEYMFGNLHIFVSTLVNMVSKKETTYCERPLAVYPSIMQMSQQELIALNHPSFWQGENVNRKRGQSYEFDQIKVYVPGDDTRNINWKASSTQNDIMVNCYEDERSQQVYSIIDKSRAMKMPFKGLTLLDYAINSTLAFSNIVLKKQDKAGLFIFSKNVSAEIKADKGPRHLKKIMYSLYKEKYDYSEANYEALYSTVKRTIPNRSLLFLYTNFDSIYSLERSIPVLRLLNKSHLLVVVFFENSELEDYSKKKAENLLDIYQLTIAKKFIFEKDQILKELYKHGIQGIKCDPEQLSADTINKYLELKSRGAI